MKKKRGKKKAVGRASARQSGVGLKPDLQRSQDASGLGSIRDRIDDIDRRIHDLLNERAQFAQQVGNSKRSEGLSTADFYKPEREAQVLRQALERNKGPLRNEEIARLFREIMSACLAQQEPLKVAFLGPEGTFSQQAVLKHFGHSVRALPLTSIGEVFEEVQAARADFGIVRLVIADAEVDHCYRDDHREERAGGEDEEIQRVDVLGERRSLVGEYGNAEYCH